jgi:hypothetical protein
MRQSASLILALILLPGCDQGDLPPLRLEIASDRGTFSIRDCISSLEGRLEFSGLSYVVGPAKGGPHSDFLYLTPDGMRIGIYSELTAPNVIVVRSPRPLSVAQVQLVRGCAG